MLRTTPHDVFENTWWSGTPYQSWATISNGHADKLPTGSVIAVRLRSVCDPLHIRRALVDFRRSYLRETIVLLVGNLDSEAAFAAVRQAALIGVATAPSALPPDSSLLRTHVCQAVRDSEWLVHWLHHACPFLNEEYPSVEPLISPLESIGHIAGRGRLQRHLAKMGMPPPTAWLRLRRCLDCAVELQLHHDLPIATVAAQLAYSEPSALSRQCMDVFGYRPSFIRERLGVAWLTAAWCERNHVPIITAQGVVSVQHA